MTDERIKCPKCEKLSVPKLWIRHRAFAHDETDHLCPYCGVVMYTNGGGPTKSSVIVICSVVVITIVSALITGVTNEPAVMSHQNVTTAPSKKYQITHDDLLSSQRAVDRYNIEVTHLEESIKRESTSYLLERVEDMRNQKEQYQAIIKLYYEERKTGE